MSFEPLAGFLAFLGQKLWAKNNKLINYLIRGLIREKHFDNNSKDALTWQAASGTNYMVSDFPWKHSDDSIYLVIEIEQCEVCQWNPLSSSIAVEIL